ncbi:MAG: glycosyl hydrolase [Saprospiraceae bacterium]|nr:glycosyl hydrolase [Saprospiraceae bacterium]
MKKISLSGFLVMVFSIASAQKTDDFFKNWQAGTSPQEIGKMVAERFLKVPHGHGGENGHSPNYITYPEVCTWYGGLTFAQLTQNNPLRDSLIKRYDKLIQEETSMIPIPFHVDYTVFGTISLEIALQLPQQKEAKSLGLFMADAQWAHPFSTNAKPESMLYFRQGLSWQTRIWIDDMYMITMIQAQAYRITKEVKYINRAAAEMVFYLKEIQRPNGLFFHAPDVPFFWGRGNGWMAAGMTELLRVLPKNNQHYAEIMGGYKKMMATLLQHQTAEGMWRQLVDDPESWVETSSTGMFTFAFITGVKNGWLDAKTYSPAARKGWLALIKYLNTEGDIKDVCEGTNKKNDRPYYLDRKRKTGDNHGQAPVLWCASALLR